MKFQLIIVTHVIKSLKQQMETDKQQIYTEMQIFETSSFWFMSIKVNKAGYYRLHDTSEKSAVPEFLTYKYL